MKLPVDAHLDRVLAFARVAPSLAAYTSLARAADMSVQDAPGAVHLVGDGVAVTLVDGSLARVLCASLGEDDSGADAAVKLGVLVTDDCEALAAAYAHLANELEARLGAPATAGQWRSTCLLHDEEHDYRYAAWRFAESILVLLLDEEGDAHIGELATLDLRIAPRAAEPGLPDSVRMPIAWPAAAEAGD